MGDRAETLYESVFDEVARVDSATEAGLVKLLEDTFRAVNIELISELAQIAHELDVDIWNVIEAAESKPFGFMSFYPEDPAGRPLYPDRSRLSFLEGQPAGHRNAVYRSHRLVNREMPAHVADRVVEQLNEHGVALSNADVLVVGAAYKPDVSDTRESPAIDIIHLLGEWHATVSYHDPHVPTLEG